MGRWHPKKCRVCGKPASLEEPISARGLCIGHAKLRATLNNQQISAHQGEFFEYWRLRTLAAFGGAPVDELTREH